MSREIRKFIDTWKDRGSERGDSQAFWLSLLRDVMGVERPEEMIRFEEPVRHSRYSGFMDAYIPSTRVLIEQKSRGIDLSMETRQSDGRMLTPIQQARNYIVDMPVSEHPRWVVTCNFSQFNIYDMNRPLDDPETVFLEDLETDSGRLSFLTDPQVKAVRKRSDISVKAGECVGRLYDALLRQYVSPDSPAAQHSLNVLCVRLVFCYYAEDAGIFGRQNMFRDYLAAYDADHMRGALLTLFRVLDTKPEDRGPYLPDDVARFPYVNGGLFRDEIEIPKFTDEIRNLILQENEAFRWRQISPTIFGAVFESTLNPQTRRTGGMHYTSPENIHRVLDPLFLDGLEQELAGILARSRSDSWRVRYLKEFKKKLTKMVFFDPACGSGNFLTETYLAVRRLENIVISEMLKEEEGQFAITGMFSDSDIGIEVSIGQFYGIEINDFAVSVSRTALWIAEHQMLVKTSQIIGREIDFLPLRTDAHIIRGNALRMDWAAVVPKDRLTCIIGNPPFSGARIMGPAQKADTQLVFRHWRNAGQLDYVACWFKLAADMMRGTDIRAALVATSSIVQGDSAGTLWKPLMNSGLHIDFAWRPFVWESEASDRAHVHCVIIGFSMKDRGGVRHIYDSTGTTETDAINAYLMPGESFYAENRSEPVSPGALPIRSGCQPCDGGQYIFTGKEKTAFLQLEPAAGKWMRPLYGSRELISREPRYILYLKNCPPSELVKMPHVMERVRAVQEFRRKSRRTQTARASDRPAEFAAEFIPAGDFAAVPRVFSQRREYVPADILPGGTVCTDAVMMIEDAGLYEFGILSSSVHMAWLKTVCGRLKSDFRYSAGIVYNNFCWPDADADQRKTVEETARGILLARDMYPGCSLADLYDSAAMPAALRRAHRANDAAVLKLYGLPPDSAESVTVAALTDRYRSAVREKR